MLFISVYPGGADQGPPSTNLSQVRDVLGDTAYSPKQPRMKKRGPKPNESAVAMNMVGDMNAMMPPPRVPMQDPAWLIRP